MKRSILFLAGAFACAVHSSLAVAPTVESLQAQADPFKGVITLPVMESTPEAVKATVEASIAESKAALDEIGRQDLAKVSFDSTVGALDVMRWKIGNVGNRITVVKETSTDKAVRDMGTDMLKVLQDYAVGLDYRQDVYQAVKAYEKTKPKLTGEAKRLYDETLRDYRRAGLELPEAKREEVEKLRKELANVGADFDKNISDANQPVTFTGAELSGVPGDFLKGEGVKTGDDEYTVRAQVTWQYLAVMENSRDEAARKKMYFARETIAQATNVPILTKMVELRREIAGKLGYASWADYQIEPRMAKTAKTANDFLKKLSTGLQPKFDAEMEELRKIKVAETGKSDAIVNAWDWRFLQNELKKQKYTVDPEALRVYFPMQATLEGMFSIYERIFGIKIEQMDLDRKWVDDLQLYAVTDAKTGEPLGLFYLDLFPREGKFNHFAEFGIVDGKLLPDGRYQRPTVALICNFPPPEKDHPSLLLHDDAETLFHEFGHAMHSILTRAQYAKFSGTNVPTDFVEAPSQMLQRWVWDKQVLDSFAADYRDPTKKIPADLIAKMEEAKLATEGFFYRRQLSFALTDLMLHGPISKPMPDVVKDSNALASKIFLPIPDGTAFVANFGHLNGYDGGYYGYAWADVIAADMATVFQQAPDRYLDVAAGRRLRNEIYSTGGSRDVAISVEKFLGRPQSIEPFLESIGIKPNTPPKTATKPAPKKAAAKK